MVHLIVNGDDCETPDRGRNLLSFLRFDVGLTGTKYGCDDGLCGTCTVLADGLPLESCRTTVGDVLGREITTIEGLARGGGELHPVQQALVEEAVVQCGYCIPGFILATVALLAEQRQPSRETIRQELALHVCRCGSYERIEREVLDDVDLTSEAEFSLSADWSEAERLPGVVQVVRAANVRYEECGVYQGGELVAVLAESDEQARRAAGAIKVRWEERPHQPGSGSVRDLLAGVERDRLVVQDQGSLVEGFRIADHVIESSYFFPHQATVPMEPSAAVARWNGDHLTVWAGTQGPFGIRGMLARRLELEEEQVRVILPDGIGTAFGNKNACPAAEEAAALARAADRTR